MTPKIYTLNVKKVSLNHVTHTYFIQNKVSLISISYGIPKFIFNVLPHYYLSIPFYPFEHIKELMRPYSLNALNSIYFLCKYFYIIII